MNKMHSSYNAKARSLRPGRRPTTDLGVCALLLGGGLVLSGQVLSGQVLSGQVLSGQVLSGPTVAAQQVQPVAAAASDAAPITLDDAITRARGNEPTFAAAVAASQVAGLDRRLAKAALLPSVVYHNQYLYTQPSKTGATAANSTPRFIANNTVHEYISQAVVTETIGVQQVTAASRASAAAAVAAAELEIARRGLVASVVNLYYSAQAAENKLAVAGRAAKEASSFTGLTQQREDAREGAHADVIKAQLLQQQRDRDLSDAKLQSEKARLELAVLLFPDPRTDYQLIAFSAPAPLASKEDFAAAATHENPELKSAFASLKASSLDVIGARAAYLPDLGMSFFYGIDAPQFAVKGPDGTRNLGYSGMVTVDIPIWDWFSTHDRIRQKLSLRRSARVALTAAQRHLIAQLDESYAEATAARAQLQSLDLSVDTARESLRLTRLRYSSGEATVLEVVDAQSSFTTVENAREDGILRYQTALANLQIMTGTL